MSTAGDLKPEKSNESRAGIKLKPEEIEISAQKNPIAISNGASKGDEDDEPEFPPGSPAEQLLSNLTDEDMKGGLTTTEAERRQREYGFNEVAEVTESAWLKYFSRFLGLVPLLM